MLTVPRLHTLLEFYGDHSLSCANEYVLGEHEDLEKLGLLERDATAGVSFFRATPLGMRVMRAANGAANAALDPEAPGPFCACGREMCCSCPICDNDE